MADSTSNASSSSHQRPRLPGDVITLILAHCDRSTRSSMLRASRECYALTLPRLYEHIAVYTPRQLRSFSELAAKARTDSRLASHLQHTRTFEYGLTTPISPFAAPASSTSSSSTIAAKDRKLYLSLADVFKYGTPSVSEPSAFTSPVDLFPNLKTASFYQLPPVTEEVYDSGTSESEYSVRFLRGVDTVHLRYAPYSAQDRPPRFHMLGLKSVQTLHLHHLLGAEIYSTSDVRRYLAHQPCLTYVHLHLVQHFEATSGRSSSSDETSEAQFYRAEYAEALTKTVYNLAYYRQQVMLIGAGGAPTVEDGNQFPALQRVVVDIPDVQYNLPSGRPFLPNIQQVLHKLKGRYISKHADECATIEIRTWKAIPDPHRTQLGMVERWELDGKTGEQEQTPTDFLQTWRKLS